MAYQLLVFTTVIFVSKGKAFSKKEPQIGFDEDR